jgi:hypothetical protein
MLLSAKRGTVPGITITEKDDFFNLFYRISSRVQHNRHIALLYFVVLLFIATRSMLPCPVLLLDLLNNCHGVVSTVGPGPGTVYSVLDGSLSLVIPGPQYRSYLLYCTALCFDNSILKI